MTDTVLGHENIKSLFERALQADRLPHAMLLVGPSGIGKRRLAVAWSQILLCERRDPSESHACGTCGSCRRIVEGVSESFLRIEPDEGKATITLDQAREVVDFTRLTSFAGRGRVVLIDQAHGLGAQAANLLLKTLEEPPPQTRFFLITSQPGALLSTIRSRCQRLSFSPLPPEVVQQITHCPPWAAEAARGSAEAALTLAKDEFIERRELAFRSFMAVCAVGSQTPHIAPEDDARIADDVRQFAKDRTQAQWLLQFWLQFARDVRVMQSGQGGQEQMIHKDLNGLQSLAIAPAIVDKVFTHTIQALSDLHGNVDRSLIVDNALVNWAHVN